MTHRCLVESNPAYTEYGGRGITVCDRWLGIGGFDRFAEDMGEKPDPSYSLDRIDNDKGYTPENCRWASKQVQALNRRKRSDNKTGVTGVYKSPYKRWIASLRMGGKQVFYETHSTFEEAVKARKRAEETFIKPILEVAK